MFSTILLGVKVSQEMSSTTVLLYADGTGVLLYSWDSCCSCPFFEFWDGKRQSVPYLWKISKQNRAQPKQTAPNTSSNKKPANKHSHTYTNGISESIKERCNKHGIQTYCRSGKILKNILVDPEDKDTNRKAR